MNIFKGLRHCAYCGDLATTRDHLIPRSYLRNTGKPHWPTSQWVPACQQCNSILYNKLFFTVQERARYLLKQYQTKRRHRISPERLFAIVNCSQMPGNGPSSASDVPSYPSLAKPQKRARRASERRSQAQIKAPVAPDLACTLIPRAWCPLALRRPCNGGCL